MTTDASNVVTFARPPEKPPSLAFVELRLVGENCGLEMTVVDFEGTAYPLKFELAEVPQGFDLDRLRAAWSRWRETSTVAS